MNSPSEASTSTPRKRSKWDLQTDAQVDEAIPPVIIKRPKIKHARPQESKRPQSPAPVPSASHSYPAAHSKYVPPRSQHPALMPSRSVYSYERLNQIEEGSYGVVFRARDKQTGDIVALKKLKLDDEKYGFPITALREINALIACKHENVVGIREIVVGETLTQCVRYYLHWFCDRKASHRDYNRGTLP